MKSLLFLSLSFFYINSAFAEGRIKNIDIASDAGIVPSKLSNIAASTILGNVTGGSGPVTALTVSQVTGLLGVAADAFDLSYTPTTPADWSVAPGNVGAALDELAGRDIVDVTDTNSINLTDTSGNISADLRISAASADAGNINATNSIETDGLQVQVPIATTSVTGVLTDTDWDTFNNKQASLPLTTKGDILTRDSSGYIRFPVCADDEVMVADAAEVSGWRCGVAATPLTFSDTASIDLTRTVDDITAALELSAAAADAGHINAVNTVEADGLQVQVPIADTSTTGVLTDTDWDTFNSKQASLPLTTKGDILTRDNSGYIRFPVCADDEVMVADSGETSGWRCGVAATPLTFSDTASIDLTRTVDDITADLELSAASADAGHINAVSTVEADGLQVQVPIADTSTTGVLTDTDWDTFNNKQPAGNYVTTISVASANGLSGSSSGGTTPSLTLSTTITGLLKGNGTAISAATSGTDYAPATSGSSILYGNGSGGFSNVTVGTGLSFSAGTLSAVPSTLSSPINQVGHGLSVGEVIYYTGTAYAKAKADADSTSEVLGIVSAVADADNFTFVSLGSISGLSGLTAGTTYYLSDTTAGEITATEPTTISHVSKPVLVAVSTTAGNVIQSRGVTITSSASNALVQWVVFGGSGSFGSPSACTSDPCTVYASSGGVTVARTNTGEYTATFPTSWANGFSCTGGVIAGSSFNTAVRDGASAKTSTSNQAYAYLGLSGSGNDLAGMQITCTGKL